MAYLLMVRTIYINRYLGHEVVRSRQGKVVIPITTKLVEERHWEERIERCGSFDRVHILLGGIYP